MMVEQDPYLVVVVQLPEVEVEPLRLVVMVLVIMAEQVAKV
jgi:hypothetical protein